MIFLHCGLGKTGSKAIQGAGARGEFVGVRYSRRGRTELARDVPSERWTKRIIGVARTTTVLLSCENTFRRDAEFRPVESRENRARYILDRFGRGDTTLVMYVRPHLPWLESLYFQSLQNRRSLEPSDFLRRFLDAGAANLSEKIRAISSETGPERFIVRIHDGSADVVADLARVMHVGLRKSVELHPNTSLSHDDIWALAALNRTDPRLCWYAIDRLRRISPTPAERSRQSVFSEREQAMIVETFAPDWMGLAPYVSADGMSGEEALRASWERSIAGRPFAVSVPGEDAEERARELRRWLTSVPGWVDSRVVERLRQWDRLVESFRWRLKIGF